VDTVVWLMLVMLLVLALAGVVLAYVAYPHRGEQVPHAPWLGDAMKRGVESLPTLANERARAAQRR
jgi:hypothetical protein